MLVQKFINSFSLLNFHDKIDKVVKYFIIHIISSFQQNRINHGTFVSPFFKMEYFECVYGWYCID
jgi:hypothetical protein